MGFFSWNCSACGKSVKAPYNPTPQWHNTAVVTYQDEVCLHGSYDGYGRIKGINLMDMLEQGYDIYHARCWGGLAIRPTGPGNPQPAEDQGFFYGKNALI